MLIAVGDDDPYGLKTKTTRKSRFVNISYNNRAHTVTFHFFHNMLFLLFCHDVPPVHLFHFALQKNFGRCVAGTYKKKTTNNSTLPYIHHLHSFRADDLLLSILLLAMVDILCKLRIRQRAQMGLVTCNRVRVSILERHF